MKLSIPQLSPALLLKQVDDSHAYVVNCSYPNSFRLLNNVQYRILQSVNGLNDVETIADNFGIEPDMLYRFFTMLEKTEIVRFDKSFCQPQKPDKPKSLNFWIHTTDTCNLGCGYCISLPSTRAKA